MLGDLLHLSRTNFPNKNSLLRRPDSTAGLRQTSLALRHSVPARVSAISRQTLARGNSYGSTVRRMR
jgi:hypothetical protein